MPIPAVVVGDAVPRTPKPSPLGEDEFASCFAAWPQAAYFAWQEIFASRRLPRSELRDVRIDGSGRGEELKADW